MCVVFNPLGECFLQYVLVSGRMLLPLSNNIHMLTNSDATHTLLFAASQVIEAARRWVQEADAELSSPSRGVTAVVGAVVEEAKAAEREELAHIRR